MSFATSKMIRSKARLTFLFILGLFLYVSINLWSNKLIAIFNKKSHLSDMTQENINSFLKTDPSLKKVLIVIGTRPEAIKMAPIILELQKRRNVFRCFVLSTGQHKEMLDQVLSVFSLHDQIDVSMDIMKSNQSLSDISALMMTQITEIFIMAKPEIVLVQGDTTTSFIAALAAFYQHIPVGHVEAGLRTRNIFSPFPEEINRLGIGNLASLHFAATQLSAENLINECKDKSKIFITGNPVVDALKSVLSIKNSRYLISLYEKFYGSRLILLTAHRRENHGQPLVMIMNAVYRLLKDFQDIVVVFPVHMNPNVHSSIKNSLPGELYDLMIAQKKISDVKYSFLNRLHLISPLDYLDLVHMMNASYIILTDSGGIQEEAVSMGIPVFVLRENTERPEGVFAGSAKLVGTSADNIYSEVANVLKNVEWRRSMTTNKNVYGNGTSAKQIADILEREKVEILHNSGKICENQVVKSDKFDVVIVLTVWKRNLLEKQLEMVKRQSLLNYMSLNLIIFQNGNHININDVVTKWQIPSMWSGKNINLTFIPSEMETGYYGRFLAPLTSAVKADGYFIVVDDDILFGDQYFENMIRLNDEGYLATRNGRFLSEQFAELFDQATTSGWHSSSQVTNENDIDYDFGGHIWAGKIKWLKQAWQNPPPSIENAEDFWLSAVLKSELGVKTRKPKCPKPAQDDLTKRPSLCACSHISAKHHVDANVGTLSVNWNLRNNLMERIGKRYRYHLLLKENPNILNMAGQAHQIHEIPVFNLTGTEMADCWLWI